MKKLKLKFKRALFAFFQEEILKSIGYKSGDVNRVTVIQKDMDVKEITADIILDEREINAYDFGLVYDEALYRAKKMLFKKFLDYIVIDERSIMDPSVRGGKEIRLSLFVGSKKK